MQQGLISFEMPGLVFCSHSDFGWLQISPSLNVGRLYVEGELVAAISQCGLHELFFPLCFCSARTGGIETTCAMTESLCVI